MEAMENMASVVTASEENPTAATVDCCNDLAIYYQTGEPCKSGLKCGPSAGTPWVLSDPITVSLAQAQPPPAPLTQIRGETPPAIWRPPASL